MARQTPTAIVGIGHSRVFRRAEVPLAHLAREAILAAVEDAGLALSDIDGIATNPNQPFEGAGSVDGIDLVTANLMRNALGLNTRWALSIVGSTVGKTVIHTVNAVAAGACNYAIAFKALNNPMGRYGFMDPTMISGQGHAGTNGQFVGTYGVTPVALAAFLMRRYMDKYNPRREDLGTFLVENRKLAMLWEWGYWRQYKPELLTLEQYMEARPVASTLGLYDCDLPVHGCAAMVITTPERARDLRHSPAYVLGTASPQPHIDNANWLYEPYMEDGKHVARVLYESAGVSAADVSVVNMYDGFSIFVPMWMEAFGLCGEGEGFAILADRRSRLDGALPVNTSSGNQGAGRMHGLPHIIDAALQVMGRSGERQIANPDISIAALGPLHDGAAMLFGRHLN
jgi:acetyl-CoA acetyltransferase